MRRTTRQPTAATACGPAAPRRRARGRWLVATTTAALLGTTATAAARPLVVRSFDGTPIVAAFHPAAQLAPGARAPTVLVGAPYPRPGDRRADLNTSDRIGTAHLRAAGYNVLTWDARGLGQSGGSVTFASPAFEGRDVQALIDAVAAQPEALLDGPGDPRVGMSGSSYGGGIQLIAAAIDARIDAIAPDVAWHSLERSLFGEDAVKAGWLLLLCSAGALSGVTDGLLGAAGTQLGSVDPAITRACAEGLGGRVSTASRRWFADRGPGALVDRIRAPTLITQGTIDVLFPLGEGIRNYEILRRNGVPVKMIWHCGGHGTCLTAHGDYPIRLVDEGLRWLSRWLERDASVDTGPPFTWLADDGAWRSGPDYPLAAAGALEGRGSGSLLLTPADAATSGGPLHASPASNAVDVALPAPREPSDVVGAPRVRLTYRGTAVPRRTLLFAQVVDAAAARVAGGQATPIPVVLDGRTRSVERDLEAIALRAGPWSSLRVQVTPATLVYGPRLALGSVALAEVDVSLPVVDRRRAARAAPAVAIRASRRPRLRVSLRREHGGVVRVVLRARQRTRPCDGTMTFTAGVVGRRPVRQAARIAPATCNVRKVVRLRARRGSSIRASARFDGNAELSARRARSVTRRVR